MSDSETVIKVENLWKQYRYGTISHATLRTDIQSWWARIRGKEDPNLRIGYEQSAKSKVRNPMTSAPNSLPSALSAEPDGSDRFWALRDISFDVKRGEVLGIIGKNGAGKSTLLKIMSRVTTPTRGQIKIKGRIASLLEVGTGFHPELTGRENIFLNGAILGMNKDEIRRKFDEIVTFAEVEKFIDTPVKRYSSGMYVRLAFAVAAHLEPEILLVDEVLAVGDALFQKKCLGKIGDVAKEGRTILFVSHNMGAIRSLCPKSILLSNGVLEVIEASETVIEKYLYADQDQESHVSFRPNGTDAYFTSIRIHSSHGKPSSIIDVMSSFRITFYYLVKRSIANLKISFSLFNRHGLKVFQCTQSDTEQNDIYHCGRYVAKVMIPGNFLAPGYYTINAGIHCSNIQIFDYKQHVIRFRVIESESGYSAFEGRDNGSVLVDFPWEVHRSNLDHPVGEVFGDVL